MNILEISIPSSTQINLCATIVLGKGFELRLAIPDHATWWLLKKVQH